MIIFNNNNFNITIGIIINNITDIHMNFKNWTHPMLKLFGTRNEYKLLILISIAHLFPESAWSGDLIPPKVITQTPTGVGLSDGSFNLNRTDLEIGTLHLERFYSGSISATDPLTLDSHTMFHGVHSSNNFDIYVVPVWTKTSNPVTYYARPVVHLGNSASGMYLQDSFNGVQTLSGDNGDAYKGDLQWVNDHYEYTDNSGALYIFSSSVHPQGVGNVAKSYEQYAQRISQIIYPNGMKRSFSYSNGQLRQVSDSSGYAIVFDWDSSGLIDSACTFNLADSYLTLSTTCQNATYKNTYNYKNYNAFQNGSNVTVLSSSINALGFIESYDYDDLALMKCITPPQATKCQINNIWSNGGVTSGGLKQILSDGSEWNFSFSDMSGRNTQDQVSMESLGETLVKDPYGKYSHYYFVGSSVDRVLNENNTTWYGSSNQPEQVGDDKTTSYVFTGGQTAEEGIGSEVNYGSMLKSVEYPDGNKYLLESNGPYRMKTKETWQAKPNSGQSDVIINYGYDWSGTPAQRVRPVWIKDANDHQTDYAYASHGGILTEMGPAPRSDAARPLTLTTWTQRFAWVKDASGTLVQAPSPVWLIASQTHCQTLVGSNNPACDGSAQQMVTSFEYGASGSAEALLLKGKAVSSAGVTLRTCYSYDRYGRKISETKPNANLGVCP